MTKAYNSLATTNEEKFTRLVCWSLDAKNNAKPDKKNDDKFEERKRKKGAFYMFFKECLSVGGDV